MAKDNVLNPEATSEYNPDYGFTRRKPLTKNSNKSRSGDLQQRTTFVDGHYFDLTWQDRPAAVAAYLKRWDEQFDKGFFTMVDHDQERWYSGCFVQPAQAVPTGNDKWTITAQFMEVANVPMKRYPTDWERDSVWLDEVNDFGQFNPAISGTGWAHNANANAFGGMEYFNDGTDATRFAQIEYVGYGFTLRSRKGPALGIAEISLDGVVLAEVDLYAAVDCLVDVHVEPEVSFGKHRVKLRATNTKNVASTAVAIVFDALRVMR